MAWRPRAVHGLGRLDEQLSHSSSPQHRDSDVSAALRMLAEHRHDAVPRLVVVVDVVAIGPKLPASTASPCTPDQRRTARGPRRTSRTPATTRRRHPSPTVVGRSRRTVPGGKRSRRSPGLAREPVHQLLAGSPRPGTFAIVAVAEKLAAADPRRSLRPTARPDHLLPAKGLDSSPAGPGTTIPADLGLHVSSLPPISSVPALASRHRQLAVDVKLRSWRRSCGVRRQPQTTAAATSFAQPARRNGVALHGPLPASGATPRPHARST